MTIRMEINSSLRRLHTLPAVRSKHTHLLDKKVASSSDLLQFESVSPSNYTSLRDLMAPARENGCSTPKRTAPQWCDLEQIHFKNQLVKQAARAYLQPMLKPRNRPVPFLVRCWTNLTNSGRIEEQAPAQSWIHSFVTRLYSRLSTIVGAILEGFRPPLFGLLCGRISP